MTIFNLNLTHKPMIKILSPIAIGLTVLMNFKHMKDKEKTERLDELNKLLDNLEDGNHKLTLRCNAIMDIYYNEIIDGYILPYTSIFTFVEYYGLKRQGEIINETRRIFASWLLNKYYKGELIAHLKRAIEEEEYEDAAIIRDALNINEMPLDRG